MWKRIISWVVSTFIFLCSLLGIHIGGSGDKVEMISYNDTKTLVTVSLDENPSTGYGWQYTASEEGVLHLTADEYHSDAPAGIVGAGGIRSLSFTGLKAGTVVLTFTYLRPWENVPIRTVVIEFKVTADKQIEAKLISDEG